MNVNEIRQQEGLTSSGKALVVTQLFRLLFGGYLIGLDQYHYNDLETRGLIDELGKIHWSQKIRNQKALRCDFESAC